MRSSFGSTIFRFVDKVFVLVLALLALFYVLGVIISKPPSVVDPDLVDSWIKQIQQKQAESRHEETRLTKDYLTSVIGSFHPDFVGFETRASIFSPPGGVPQPPIPTLPREIRLSKPIGEGPGEPALRRVPDVFADAEIQVTDEAVVRVEWSGDESSALQLTPLGEGTSEVTLSKDGKVLGKTNIVVEIEKTDTPVVLEPADFTAAPEQGRVKIAWRTARVAYVTLTEYRVYKGEGDGDPGLWLLMSLPAEMSDGAELPTVIEKTGKPGPVVVWIDGRFSLTDEDIDADVQYRYAVDAVGKDKDDAPITGSLAGPVNIRVEEPFRIEFRTLSQDAVTLVVSVFYVPEDEGEGTWVTRSFIPVERGSPVGWKVSEVRPPGTNLRIADLDFSTGYQVLDILNEQRRIQKEDEIKDRDTGEVIGVRQHEETRQKVLLINERGRIKVLWPSVPGLE